MKGTIDAILESHVQEIDHHYPTGKCKQHPDIQCLYYAHTKLHFKLDRHAKLAWAAKIVFLITFIYSSV
jgi:hypothetical protein